jgi:hypothetical protein
MQVSARVDRWNVSDIILIGDESIILHSNFSFSNLNSSSVFLNAISSEGFGGMDPIYTINKL